MRIFADVFNIVCIATATITFHWLIGTILASRAFASSPLFSLKSRCVNRTDLGFDSVVEVVSLTSVLHWILDQ